MAKSKKEVFPILLDLHYRYSMNKFEEFYGESVYYSEIEQVSYIDLKEMVFEKISKDIKFRKFGRQGNVLTIKMDINLCDYELFLKIFKEEDIDEEATERSNGKTKYQRFDFIHDFTVSNIRDLTREEKIKFKKIIESDDFEDEELVIEEIEDSISLEEIDEEVDDED